MNNHAEILRKSSVRLSRGSHLSQSCNCLNLYTKFIIILRLIYLFIWNSVLFLVIKNIAEIV